MPAFESWSFFGNTTGKMVLFLNEYLNVCILSKFSKWTLQSMYLWPLNVLIEFFWNWSFSFITNTTVKKVLFFNKYSNVFYQNLQFVVPWQLALQSRFYYYDFYTLMFKLSGIWNYLIQSLFTLENYLVSFNFFSINWKHSYKLTRGR